MNLSEFIFQVSKFVSKNRLQRRMILLKNDDFIEIFIPASGLFSRFTIINLVFLIFPAYLINLFMLSLPYQNARFLAPVIIFNFLISVVGIGIILLSEFAQKRLSITRKKISWAYEIFGWKLKDPYPAAIQGIIRITKTQNSWNRYFLGISSGRRLYEFSTSEFSPFAVTNHELDLIAKELSNWMELTLLQE
ncbi:hypothetical protein [Calothrix sp. UHCC 0171]|uniref:hypothetical protein n=1 Tax=Calothrix sp. UHCC 0171 TaxID=3110245 RepID=UPI002B202EC5|nr:hypothetical protein [Calothrix sp. UHCC 0171]MEA5573235.1 hypothetical protein [Calothrix sp. UHCC 0171]